MNLLATSLCFSTRGLFLEDSHFICIELCWEVASTVDRKTEV